MMRMLKEILARMRSLWSGASRGSRIDAEINEEFRHHIDLRTQDLIRDGLTRKEAARRAGTGSP